MVRFEQAQSRRQLIGQLLWFLLWLAVTVSAFLLRPSPRLHGTHEQLGLPPCPSVLLFDRPCLSCGLTTSFSATTHLDIVTALKAHPLGPAFYLLFTLSAFTSIYGWATKRYLDTNSKAFTRVVIGLTIVFVAYGAFRMATTTYGSEAHKIAKHASTLRGGEESR